MNRAGLSVAVALLGLSGCSLGADEEKGPAAPARGATREVDATIRRLDRAIRTRDWGRVCALFTPAARERAGGKDCPRLVGSSAGNLREARLKLVGVELAGATARARVRTRARGQGTLTDTLTLRRAKDGYLVESLR